MDVNTKGCIYPYTMICRKIITFIATIMTHNNVIIILHITEKRIDIP